MIDFAISNFLICRVFSCDCLIAARRGSDSAQSRLDVEEERQQLRQLSDVDVIMQLIRRTRVGGGTDDENAVLSSDAACDTPPPT